MLDPTITRLHRCLVQAMRARGTGDLDRPVTVAEIYQDLVPYRSVREALDVEMNADYEHALLRLLAGEGGLARIEPESARDELRKELDSSNPYVGAYRNFAACDVFITAVVDDHDDSVNRVAQDGLTATDPSGAPSTRGTPVAPGRPAAQGTTAEASAASTDEADPARRVEASTASPVRPARRGEPSAPRATGSAPDPRLRTGTATAPAAKPAPAAAGGATTQRSPAGRVSTGAGTTTAPASGGVPASSCAFCTRGLPSDRSVRYCPYCGADQRQRPCPECAEPLDRAWHFCIRCGTAVARNLGAPSGGG